MSKINVRSTSIDALKNISRKRLAEKQQHVFNVLIKHGDEGLTTKEIEILTGDPHTDSRVWELVKSGWIVRTDRKKRNPGPLGIGNGAVASIIIVPKHVREGGEPIPILSRQTQRHCLTCRCTQGIQE